MWSCILAIRQFSIRTKHLLIGRNPTILLWFFAKGSNLISEAIYISFTDAYWGFLKTWSCSTRFWAIWIQILLHYMIASYICLVFCSITLVIKNNLASIITLSHGQLCIIINLIMTIRSLSLDLDTICLMGNKSRIWNLAIHTWNWFIITYLLIIWPLHPSLRLKSASLS